MIKLEIDEGSLVRYSGTGTVGTVKVMKEEDGKKWALLDTTSLYYDVSTLEPIDKIPERKELEGFSLEEIERRMKAQAEQLQSVKMQDDNLETGG
ncbi:MAG TPA: DUF2098 domain-containing protein [Methanotrichaceae archaeon]|nr:DUF2098 domain-containing protein [Methanotrichaceae archaeon]